MRGPSPASSRGRLSRAALVLGGVLTGTALVQGCGGDETDEGDRDAAVDDGGAVGALYGAPVDGGPEEGIADAQDAQDATEGGTRPRIDGGGNGALYGQPP